MTVVCVEDGEREQGEISTLSLSPLFEWMQFVIHSSLPTQKDTREMAESQHTARHRSVDECSVLRWLNASFLVLLESLRCTGAAADGIVSQAFASR